MDEQERINETEEAGFEREAETSAELAEPVGATAGHPESAEATGPYVSEDGSVMGRDFVIPGVDPSEHDPYRFHTGRRSSTASTSASPRTRSRWCSVPRAPARAC